jgi:hypothetical protein
MSVANGISSGHNSRWRRRWRDRATLLLLAKKGIINVIGAKCLQTTFECMELEHAGWKSPEAKKD